MSAEIRKEGMRECNTSGLNEEFSQLRVFARNTHRSEVASPSATVAVVMY
jgi:hypothetical protein